MRKPARQGLFFIGVGLILVAAVALFWPLGIGCGSFIDPGPEVIVGAESGLFQDMGCSSDRRMVLRISVALAVGGLVAIIVGRVGRDPQGPSV